jgi:predicted PurR-regulated permease PerM
MPDAPGTGGSVPLGEARVEQAVREADLDWRSVATAMACFAALVALTGVVRSAPRTITYLVVGTMLALALNPLVTNVENRLRLSRSAALAVVLASFAILVSTLVVVLTPPAVREARQLQEDLPAVVADLEELPFFGDDLAEADAPERVQRWIETLPDRLEGDTAPIERAGRIAVDSILGALVIGLIAVSLLLDGERILRGARRLVPAHRRLQAERMADLAYRVVGRYVAGSLFVAVIAGVSVLVVGLVLGVPLTPLVAVWVAVFDLVPQIGGAAGGIPFVLLGFTEGAGIGLACAVFFVLYLQFENHILQPLVVGQAVKLSPPATMTAALVGVSAAGVVGALVAVPLLGAAKAVYVELRPPPDPALA